MDRAGRLEATARPQALAAARRPPAIPASIPAPTPWEASSRRPPRSSAPAARRRRGARALSRSALLLAPLVALSTVGCYLPPPTPDDVTRLAHVEGLDARIYYRDLDRASAAAVLPHIAAVRSEVHGQLGYAPPRTEVVVYRPSVAEETSPTHHVRETRCDLVQEHTGWRIRFVYPWSGALDALGPLLGTTAHEVAEATVLLQVTVLDPYLRWMHDGIAELIEHRAIARLAPDEARSALRRTLEFVEQRRADGTAWADLTRWRQIAPWVVRSHRVLGPNERNLSLDDVGTSLDRVRAALAEAKGGPASDSLQELEAMLVRHDRLRSRAFAPGEARPDDPRTLDYLFYNLSFAYWLSLEADHPGTLRRFMAALDAHRQGGDHVISMGDALTLLEGAAGARLPDPARMTLEQAEAALRTEEQLLLGVAGP